MDWPAHKRVCAVLKFPIEFAWSSVAIPCNLKVDYTHRLGDKVRCPRIEMATIVKYGPGISGITVRFTNAAYGVDVNLDHPDDDKSCPLTSKAELKKRRKNPDTREIFCETREGSLQVGRSQQGCDCETKNGRFFGTRAGDAYFRFPHLAALARALGLVVEAWSLGQPLKKDQVVPILPPQPYWLLDVLGCEGNRRKQEKFRHVDSGKQVPYLSRLLVPAGLKIEDDARPLLHHRTHELPGPAPEVFHLEAVIRIPTRCPGPFFAIPGDQIITMILARVVDVPLGPDRPHPLGLKSGQHVATVEFNAATGVARILDNDGWRIVAVPMEALEAAGYFQMIGPLCESCCKTEGQAGWKWPANGRRVWKERVSQFGWTSTCYCNGYPHLPWRPFAVLPEQAHEYESILHLMQWDAEEGAWYRIPYYEPAAPTYFNDLPADPVTESQEQTAESRETGEQVQQDVGGTVGDLAYQVGDLAGQVEQQISHLSMNDVE